MTDTPETENTEETKAKSPWASYDDLSNEAFLSPISIDSPVRIPHTNIVITPDDNPIRIDEADTRTAENLDQIEAALTIIDALRIREIEMTKMDEIQFVLKEGSQITLLYGDETYRLSPKAEIDLLSLLGVEKNTFSRLADYEIRKTVLDHRLSQIIPEIILAGEKLEGGDETNHFALCIVYGTDNYKDHKADRYVTALMIAPDLTVEVNHLYPTAMLKTLREIPSKYKQAITGFNNSGLPLVDEARTFCELDGGKYVLKPSRLLMTEHEGSPYLSARVVNTKDTFSIIDGDHVSPSGICEQTCVASGSWKKNKNFATESSFNPGGLYRWICMNGAKILANEFDYLYVALNKFYQIHPETPINVTFDGGNGEYKQIEINSMNDLVDRVNMNYARDFATTAHDFDHDLQDLIKEVRRAAGVDKPTVINTDDVTLVSAVYAQIRESEEKSLKELLNRMQGRSMSPIMYGIATSLSGAEIATQIISAIRLIGIELKMDPTLVRNVCVAMLQTYRKNPTEIVSLTPWHLLNLITLCSHQLKAGKRTYAEEQSARWVNTSIEIALNEIKANRAPSNMILAAFSKFIHEAKAK